MMGTIKTTILLTALTVLLMLMGDALGGRTGMTIGLMMGFGFNLIQYWYSDKIVLAMYGAREVGRADAPRLYAIVEELARKGNLPMPRVYIIDSATPNAFATGRNPEHAAVAATTGILSILDDGELAGVMAHELGHVAHRDTLISTIAAGMASAIGFAGSLLQWGAMFGLGRRDDDEGGGVIGMLALAIIAPLAATLIQLAVSRSREYMADEYGAKLHGNPLDLARALAKLDRGVHAYPIEATPAKAATAHLFIVNPLRGGGLASLFSTHPPMEERIARLQRMSMHT